MSAISHNRQVQPRDSSIHDEDEHHKKITVGTYLAQRLVEAGAKDYFAIPGDFILILLDELLKDSRLSYTGCCNELNAGYAADGYCRATGGIGVVCVTYMVGGLSVINAVAGAYSDDLPVLVVSGGPNNRDEPEHHLIHHTIGEYDLYQASRCFAPVVAKTFVIRHIEDCATMIDEALVTCLSLRKPVYLEIACNLVSQKIPQPNPRELNLFKRYNISDNLALSTCVDDIKNAIKISTKPVLVAGVKLRVSEATHEFLNLANALGCGVGVMPDAKGLFPESHPLYMGCYWGSVSGQHCGEIVESADLLIFVGPVFNDYTTTGWTTLVNSQKLISINRNFVSIGGRRYSGVYMKEIIALLIKQVPVRDQSIAAFRRYKINSSITPVPLSDQPLELKEFRQQVQNLLTPKTSLIVETGDSWFIGQKFTLPDGAHFHVQMQYGSIGWSVGATLGIALGVGDYREVIALIGDGSFQMTAQELSTIIRRNVNCTIFLLNNYGYTIEVQIHDNVYNDIQNWKYTELVEVFRNEGNNCHAVKVSTSQQLADAIAAMKTHEGVNFIECILNRYDCTNTLLEWGSRVALSNGRV